MLSKLVTSQDSRCVYALLIFSMNSFFWCHLLLWSSIDSFSDVNRHVMHKTVLNIAHEWPIDVHLLTQNIRILEECLIKTKQTAEKVIEIFWNNEDNYNRLFHSVQAISSIIICRNFRCFQNFITAIAKSNRERISFKPLSTFLRSSSSIC